METYSFLDIVRGHAIEGVNRIVIPKIQRDYAQGRSGRRATDVRRLFSASLAATLGATDNAPQMLDFIYGYVCSGSFEPLDGQQRLTTLFLLHWLVLPAAERKWLKHDGAPVLSYLTRVSARDFCRFLVDIDREALAREFDAAVEKGANPRLSSYVRELDDFRHGWEYDPTVKSMLRMLDTLMRHFGSFAAIDRGAFHTRLDNIRFNLLNLSELSQGDELYVKMNARGLELSDFDNTKSALEGDMLDAGVDTDVQTRWREGIDGDWIDYFWHRAGADVPGRELKDKEIAAIEDDLKTFLLRMVTLRWFYSYYGLAANDFEQRIEAMTESARTRRQDLSPNLTEYLALRFRDAHSAASGACPAIDFKGVVEDIDSLLYEENGRILAADSLAPTVRRLPDSAKGFIDSALDNEFSQGNRIILYGMLAFTRRFSAADIAADPSLRADWTVWLRLLRNLSLARNSNAPFDALDEVKEAMLGIDGFMAGFAAARPQSMADYILTQKGIAGCDAAIFQEEQDKLRLRVSPDWCAALDRFDNEGYLFGQLRAPLQWAHGDVERFARYCVRLNRLMTEQYPGELLYAALLVVSDRADRYPMGDALLTFDFNRDRSFKRYLREQSHGEYAPALRKIIDLWQDDVDVATFLRSVIAARVADGRLPLWRRQLAEFPEIIVERSHQRRILVPKEGDNVYLIESKQSLKSWNVNLCWLRKTRYKGAHCHLHNTKEEGPLRDSIAVLDRVIVATGPAGALLPLTPSPLPRHRTLRRHKK